MLNLNSLKILYENSPLWVKNVYASIPYEIRNGQEYRKWKLFLENNLNIEEYQLLKIKETLLYAYEHTDYYKKTFNQLKCTPFDVNSIKDLNVFPLIDKDTVKENFNDIKVKNYPSTPPPLTTTGGTNGQPMKFLQSKNVSGKEVAFVNNYLSSLGYTPKQLKASFRGGDFDNISNNKFWKQNPINNEIHFSPFHINNINIYYYIKELNRMKVKFFHTYPSGIIALINNMKNNGLKLNYQVQGIFLISENFRVDDINYIEDYFKCKVSSFFGHSERLVFASLNTTKNSYQLNQYYGLTELINESKELIISSNIKGELVGTSFDNYAMPLIRYRTGDYTSYKNHDKQIINLIQGRWENEFISGKNGLQLITSSLSMSSDTFNNCMSFQFIQKKIGEVELLVIPKKDFNDIDRNQIIEALNKKTGYAINFTIKIVFSLRLTKRGKLKRLIKEIE